MNPPANAPNKRTIGRHAGGGRACSTNGQRDRGVVIRTWLQGLASGLWQSKQYWLVPVLIALGVGAWVFVYQRQPELRSFIYADY